MRIKQLYKLGFVFLFSGISVLSVAQTTDSSEAEWTHEDFRKKIPSLESLIDSACINSPILKSQQASIDINQLRLKITKNEWIRNISIESSYQYGMFGNVLLNPDSTDPLANSVLTTNKQTRYSTGLSIKLPISEIISRKHQIQIGEETLQQTELEKEKLTEELRKLVIIQYNDLMLKHKILLISNNNLQSQNLQLQMTEKEFLNNKVNVSEFARIREMQTKSEIEFETAKSAFNTSFQILQEITEVKFNP
ncbi:MAG TPA: TolC family protein [Prolixibacteraceae bacterium]|nr:TolC family protein [Prolixibacteraceae bacterium]